MKISHFDSYTPQVMGQSDQMIAIDHIQAPMPPTEGGMSHPEINQDSRTDSREQEYLEGGHQQNSKGVQQPQVFASGSWQFDQGGRVGEGDHYGVAQNHRDSSYGKFKL